MTLHDPPRPPPTPRLRYLPSPPPDSVRRREILFQVLRLPRTLLAIGRIVREDCARAALDEHLSAFQGFLAGSPDPRCRARVWHKVRLASIGPADAAGLPVWEMAYMLDVAREIEEPILEYSRQNAEGFRVLLPSLSRLLGDTRDAPAGAASFDRPWVAEERRHAPAFARIIERLTGTTPGRENPNRPKQTGSSEAEALALLNSRQAAEWNSSSTYTVLAAHARGDLHHLIRNVARDEIKHLAILGAADRHLFGQRPWRRMKELIRKGLLEYRGHQRGRSSGRLMGTNPITAFEVIVAHLLIERRIRKWLRGLSPATLEPLFSC